MKGKLSKPELVLFDWDNTLVDTAPVISDAMSATLEKMRLEDFSAEEKRTAMNLSLRDRFPKLFGERWEEARDIYYAMYEKYAAEGLKPLSGAQACLTDITGAAIPMGVISNKRGAVLRQEIHRIGWHDYFVGATGALDAEEDKPSVLMFRQFLQASALSEPSHLWMVGDSEADMQFAHNIGAGAIFIGDADDLPSQTAGFVDVSFPDVTFVASGIKKIL